MAKKPTGGGESYAELRQRSRTVLGRQKLADGGPVFSANNWQATPPNLPSVGIESSRKVATDFRAGYGVGDVSASGNYQKATDGGKDSYGARVTYHKSFAAGGTVKPKPKPKRKADGGPVGLGETLPWQMPVVDPIAAARNLAPPTAAPIVAARNLRPKSITPPGPAPAPISVTMPQPLSASGGAVTPMAANAAARQMLQSSPAAKAPRPAKRGGRQTKKGGRS